jgi:hypothetical protein
MKHKGRRDELDWYESSNDETQDARLTVLLVLLVVLVFLGCLGDRRDPSHAGSLQTVVDPREPVHLLHLLLQPLDRLRVLSPFLLDAAHLALPCVE